MAFLRDIIMPGEPLHYQKNGPLLENNNALIVVEIVLYVHHTWLYLSPPPLHIFSCRNSQNIILNLTPDSIKQSGGHCHKSG